MGQREHLAGADVVVDRVQALQVAAVLQRFPCVKDLGNIVVIKVASDLSAGKWRCTLVESSGKRFFSGVYDIIL